MVCSRILRFYSKEEPDKNERILLKTTSHASTSWQPCDCRFIKNNFGKIDVFVLSGQDSFRISPQFLVPLYVRNMVNASKKKVDTREERRAE